MAFITTVFARYIVGWKVSRTARTHFVLDAQEQALCVHQPFARSSLIHPSDRGVHYGSIRYTECLAEVIHQQSWQGLETVEWATLTWVDGFNHRRLLGAHGLHSAG